MISATPRADKLILLEDFNARVGTGHQTWEGVIETEGVGREVWQQWLPPFKQMCRAWTTDHHHSLPSTNKTSWMHHRSKHLHLIDYVIARRKDRRVVRVTKTMYAADCWTDHRLAVSKLNLHIQPVQRPQVKKVPKILDVSKMKQDTKRQHSSIISAAV